MLNVRQSRIAISCLFIPENICDEFNKKSVELEKKQKLGCSFQCQINDHKSMSSRPAKFLTSITSGKKEGRGLSCDDQCRCDCR